MQDQNIEPLIQQVINQTNNIQQSTEYLRSKIDQMPAGGELMQMRDEVRQIKDSIDQINQSLNDIRSKVDQLSQH